MGELNRREEITVGYKCNIQCRFCFYGCSPKDSLKSFEEIKRDIFLCKRYGIKHIELSGGEPTIHPDIEAIIEFCHKQGFETICMITNGVLLKDIERIKSLIKRGLNQFVFSLHGADEKTHNYLTKADTFRSILKAMNNTRLLNIPFRINVVVTKNNYKELTRIADLALEIKPFMINYLIYSPLNFSKNFVNTIAGYYSDMVPEISEAVDIVKDYMKVRIRYIPFCLIKGYEKYVCNVHQLHYDLYEWDYCLREHIHNGLFYKLAKIAAGLFHIPVARFLTNDMQKSFHEAIIETMCIINSCKPLKCRKCRYYFICDGVWKSYASVYGLEELNPLRGRKIIDPAYLMIDYN